MQINEMNANQLEVLHRDDLPLGGFAGLKEHRMVQDQKAWGENRNPAAWDGIGSFVYLANSRFVPKGETGMHPHREIDVISIMVEGRISHGGSLEDGKVLAFPQVQIQSAGSEGFKHNEVNPDDMPNRMLQLWVLPEQKGLKSGYQVIDPQQGNVTRIYGGLQEQQQTFPSATLIDVAMLDAIQRCDFEGPFLAYLSKGRGTANGVEAVDGDLIRGESLRFVASENVQLTVVRSPV